jgi:hypothetical protein
MKSLDMTNEQMKMSLSKKTLQKNSSSSQMNLHSSKKMLYISDSHKNSELLSKQFKKPSQDSTNSFSIKKLDQNQSDQFSNQKIQNELGQFKGNLLRPKRIKVVKNKSELSNVTRPVYQHKKAPSSTQHKLEMGLNLIGTNVLVLGRVNRKRICFSCIL